MHGRSGERGHFDRPTGSNSKEVFRAIGLGKAQTARAKFHLALFLCAGGGIIDGATRPVVADRHWPLVDAAAVFFNRGAGDFFPKTLASPRFCASSHPDG